MNRSRKSVVGIYSKIFGHRKGNSFMTLWMDLEEIRQRKANAVYSHFFVGSKKAELIEMKIESCLPGAWALFWYRGITFQL